MSDGDTRVTRGYSRSVRPESTPIINRPTHSLRYSPFSVTTSRAIKASIQQLKTHVLGAKSRVEKILKGGGSPGARAAPARVGKHDADIGVRLDYGDMITRNGIEYQRYKLQANKQAANATIKAIAAKNSHQVLAEVDVPINPAPEKADETLENMFDHLEKNITYTI